ncbi:tyrosine--tRNA ligase [Candidatus Parcubacteria bacterium A4]|nr:MAG: tyrosine--tRNA ligase [Candidatus Parcubacteria bacterium A4]
MAINTDVKKIEEILTRGVAEILPNKNGLGKLMGKRRLRVYLGIDPTATRLHLGHSIGLRKLQDFVELGHEVILVFGTGTVLAGDPSLRESTRPKISEEEIEKNIKTWKSQAGKILDLSRAEVRYNGDWLLKLGLREIIDIASNISAIKLFQRKSFQTRLEKGDTVWMHETLYPLLQGYDSVALDVDLEIGGTDQVFNMLIGRELQQKMNEKEKFVITVPMIFGTDGKQMSKSSGNCIWLEDLSGDMFGKIMSIPDNLMVSYFELLTVLPIKDIENIKKNIASKKVNPRDIKARLAFEIVKMYHGEKEARKAGEEFSKIFTKKQMPSDISSHKLKASSYKLLDLLVETKIASSKAEARRLVEQGGVKIDGQIQNDWQEIVETKEGMILQSGKRKFIELI